MRRWYRLVRDLHLYLGLFICPLVLLFAVSAIVLVLKTAPWEPPATLSRKTIIRLPRLPAGDDIGLAQAARRELGLAGEIGFVRLSLAERRLSFPLERPGERTEVTVDLGSGAAEAVTRGTGLWDALAYLHKKPGPHNVKLRGNWTPMVWWAWLADATIYLLLFGTASGLYLWIVLKRERKLGLVLLGLGTATFVAATLAVVG